MAISFFRTVYLEGERLTDKNKFGVGVGAIKEYADYIRKNGLKMNELGHFVYFALPLGAKRASDYATFFKPHNKILSKLKSEQAKLFGECHTLTTKKSWKILSQSFIRLAETEDKFRSSLLKTE